MPNSRKYFDPQTLAKLRGLRLRARRVVEGFAAGLHRSPYRGFSVEFAEHREYAPGDDLRYVDWKAFGRTDKFYLKQFEDETNLICYLVLDGSESMQYRGPAAAMSKFEYAQCLAACVAWLVLGQQDSVGLSIFDREIRADVPPGAGAAHLQRLVDTIEAAVPQQKTDAGAVFHRLAEKFKRRGVVLVLSDLLDDVDSVLGGLKHFRHRKHDVLLLHVLDAAELDFPFEQPTLFRGLEQLPAAHADPRAIRRAYLEQLQAFLDKVRNGCHAQGVEHHLLRTDRPFDEALGRCLAPRMTANR